jgi:hypothetical protein
MRKTEPRQPKIFILIILLGILSLGLFLCEMTIRYLGTYDLDGNFQATVLKNTVNSGEGEHRLLTVAPYVADG